MREVIAQKKSTLNLFDGHPVLKIRGRNREVV
jgi:hypothetical protein